MADKINVPAVKVGKVDGLTEEVMKKIKEKKFSAQEKKDFLTLLSEQIFAQTHPRIIRLDLKKLGKNFGQ